MRFPGAERAPEQLASAFRVRVLAAGEDIDGGVAVLGPRVNRDVGFGEQRERRHALGFEAVSDLTEQCGIRRDGGLPQRLADEPGVVEPFAFTTVELENTVGSDVLQWRVP